MSGSSSRNGMRSVLDLSSSMFAVAISQMTCPDHENCDGSCAGSQIVFSPILSPSANSRVTISPRPRKVPIDCIRRNMAWLMEQHLDEFVYDPLETSTRTIRLLTIKPAVFREDVVECDLLEASLDDSPSYIALSYHWGPPEFCHTIIINGKAIAITQNLHTALKSYRRGSYTTEKGMLWVDALCINQKDMEERTSQVLLMRQIYSNASSVRIDLGDVENN